MVDPSSFRRFMEDGISAWRRAEGPTWLVAVGVHGGWLAATAFHQALPAWALPLLGGWLVAWHGSLEHEVIHGHPTRVRWINRLVVGLPLALWLPHAIYRSTHLAHHRTERLTEPGHDPESHFLDAETWARMGPISRGLQRTQTTLLGRLVLGPVLVLARFFAEEARRLRAGEPGRRGAWARHLALAAIVVAWVSGICGMSLWRYLAFFVYPGLSLTLLRSFLEHRPASAPGHRTAVVEAGPVLSLLFLNNNLHAVHHEAPRLAWFRLPARYRRDRAGYLARNGGYLWSGYAEIAARHLLTPKDGKGLSRRPARAARAT